MTAIVTSSLRKENTDNLEKTLTAQTKDRIYAFIGKSTQWANEQSPDAVTDSIVDKTKFYNDVIGGKIVASNAVYNVARRIDWVNGFTFDEYRDDIDLVFGNSANNNEYPQFYCMTDELNVYKCINNNINQPSTVKPTGQSTSILSTADGYKWKFMFTIDSVVNTNYTTTEYMPVQTLTTADGSAQWLAQEAAVDGSIESITVTNGGSSYTSSNPPTITITGDGSNCTATPVIDDGSGTLIGVNITTSGSGYTTGNVVITSNGAGINAAAKVNVSPYGGHGKDAVNELGAVFKIMSVKLVDTEGGNIPINISYRRLGLIINPLSNTTGKVIDVSNISGTFTEGETVSGDTSSATGTVVYADYIKNKVYITVTGGAFQNGETITGGTSTATATTVSIATGNLPLTADVIPGADLLFGSGDIIYMENRTSVDRLSGQVEHLRFVVI